MRCNFVWRFYGYKADNLHIILRDSYLLAPALETDLIEICGAMDVLCGLDAGTLDSRVVRVGEAIMRVDGLFDLTIVHTFSERRTNTYISELA